MDIIPESSEKCPGDLQRHLGAQNRHDNALATQGDNILDFEITILSPTLAASAKFDVSVAISSGTTQRPGIKYRLPGKHISFQGLAGIDGTLRSSAPIK